VAVAVDPAGRRTARSSRTVASAEPQEQIGLGRDGQGQEDQEHEHGAHGFESDGFEAERVREFDRSVTPFGFFGRPPREPLRRAASRFRSVFAEPARLPVEDVKRPRARSESPRAATESSAAEPGAAGATSDTASGVGVDPGACTGHGAQIVGLGRRSECPFTFFTADRPSSGPPWHRDLGRRRAPSGRGA